MDATTHFKEQYEALVAYMLKHFTGLTQTLGIKEVTNAGPGVWHCFYSDGPNINRYVWFYPSEPEYRKVHVTFADDSSTYMSHENVLEPYVSWIAIGSAKNDAIVRHLLLPVDAEPFVGRFAKIILDYLLSGIVYDQDVLDQTWY